MQDQAFRINKVNQENAAPKTAGPHGGDRLAAQARWGFRADQFLDFSASINPLGPSPVAVQAIRENLDRLDWYPDPEGHGLKKELALYLQTEEQRIVLGNGSLELIYLCGQMFGSRRVIVLAPDFSEYGQGILKPQVIKVNLDLNQLCVPLSELSAILAAGDLLFVANPNNPAGTLFSREELLQLSLLVKERQAVLVLDEAFIDFVGENNASLRDVSDQNHLIILGSLTKFFALPGLRIGYALSSRNNIQTMEKLLPRWRINTLALAAATASLQDRGYMENSIRLVAAEREYLSSELIKIAGFRAHPSHANFILVDAGGRGITAGELQQKLGPEGILIRDCSNFANLSPGYFRLAVRNHEENQTFIEILRKVLDS